MFSKYYQSELTYLRELGREFSRANPAIAGMLAERGGDPDVERLLEGFAFLTARIRERIDDDMPEVVHGLTELLLPHYLRPLPAATIVEFAPLQGALKGRYKVARGTELVSAQVEGTACRFRTTAPVDLLPLSLVDVVHEQPSAAQPSLRLQFQTSEQARGAVFDAAGIRLHMHGEPPVATMLHLWLTKKCSGITVRGASGRRRPVKLPTSNIKLVGFGPDEAMLPEPTFAPAGFRLVREYFTLAPKFYFVDITGLDAAIDAAEERFEIVLQFERPPQLGARIAKENLRLHCAPAVNLFNHDADPIVRDPTVPDYLLRPSEIDPKGSEVYSVESVTGLQAGRSERRVYHSFHSFAHAIEAPDKTAYYRVRRSMSIIDDGMDTRISLLTPRDVAPVVAEETISTELVCTNRSLAGLLRAGDVNSLAPGVTLPARFKNVAAVTKPARPPLGQSLHWRLLSHLAVNQRSLADATVLRAALDLYNFQTDTDRQASRANRLRIEGIKEVSAKPADHVLGGVPVRGVGVHVELDEDGFVSEGDAHLFACVLDELFAGLASLNSFSKLSIKLAKSGERYEWQAKNGRQPIL